MRQVPVLLVAASLFVASPLAVSQNRPLIPLPHDPEHAQNPIKWCAYHLARRELVAALSDCDYALTQNPTSVAALSNRGSVWLLAGEAARAILDFDAALEIAPTDASLYFNRGIAQAKVGKPERAIADYTEAVRLQPNFAIAHHNRGYELQRMLRVDEALADYRRALELDPALEASSDAIRRLERQRQ